jgi:ssDNA-binding Zn-finger/Zn-ribbon topoisomerase 1
MTKVKLKCPYCEFEQEINKAEIPHFQMYGECPKCKKGLTMVKDEKQNVWIWPITKLEEIESNIITLN